MKEKVPNKSKESRKPSAARSDKKEKVKLRRRMSDRDGPSLEQQYKDIVETARIDAVTKMVIKQQIEASQSVKVKHLQVALNDCGTPGPSFKRDTVDVAPSPMTPPHPKRIRLAKENVDDAPSPEGMDLNHLSQPSNVSHALFIQEFKEETEETTFFDAQDTSIIESGDGLNLDVLIDEIFVNHTDHSSPEATDPLCTTPVQCSDATTAPITNEPELLAAPNTSEATETGRHTPCTSLPLQNETLATKVNSEICEDGSEKAVLEKGDSGAPKTNLDEYQGSSQNATAVADIPSKETMNDRNIVEEPALPILNISDGVSVTSHDNIIEVFLNGEGFHDDDFSLSETQILDIDAKCRLVRATTEQHSVSPIQRDIHNDITDSTQPAGRENNSLVLPKPPVDLGFSLPSAPRLDWMQKALESRQRLRTLTQEISRLK